MKKILWVCTFIFFSFMLSIDNIKGNSAEPPMVWILVPGTYQHVEGVMIIDSGTVPGVVSENKMETYIRFFYYKYPNDGRIEEVDGNEALFVITLDNQQYFIEADIRGYGYNDLYTLDVETLTLIKGKTFERDAFLVSLRLVSTLILEGLIFFLMGYRKRRTWVLFLIINLVTQGFLNLLINSGNPVNVYMLFALIVYESLIIMVEEVVLLFSIREGKKRKLFFTILLANLLSLFLGGWFIVNLPL